MGAVISTIVGAVIVIIGLTWIVQGNDWFMYHVFAPKYEQVRRQTFEQSRAFNEGMAQELAKAELEYQRAPDQSSRDAIHSYVQQRLAGYDLDMIENPQLRTFADKMVAP